MDAYTKFIPAALLNALWNDAQTVEGVTDMRVSRQLLPRFSDWLTPDALCLVRDVFREVRPQLESVLANREGDRCRLDDKTLEMVAENEDIDYHDADYKTCIGLVDPDGRLVIGPYAGERNDPPKMVKVPSFLEGDQVTLFGPPDSAKMAINAMNTIHRRLPGEVPIVEELLRDSAQSPRWGADNEDSKTPMMTDLISASRNLYECYRGTLAFDDPKNGKVYRLAETGLSKPIKRIAGLALPDAHHLLNGELLPLHLTDMVLHVYHNRDREEALVFYVPKLENEEEARYLKTLIEVLESRIKSIYPEYQLGSIRLFIVFENPRAIFRIREMADALYPHFVGGSLGWHDFLGSTARLFKHDPNYRIPVKADPNIVINHIRESHQILVDSLQPIGGICIGGMYGVLYEDGNEASFEVSIVGYIKDVVTQLKRELDGFWVAHPSFVRIGIAIVEAFRRWQNDDKAPLLEILEWLVPRAHVRKSLIAFIEADDVDGLSRGDALYERGVLAADIAVSDVIENHDPEEVRYNVFQALQYLADWLSGNGCVALPATMTNHEGETVFVRVMDDLATTERSRWELWAEVHHGRVSVDLFSQILDEEIAFIREDRIEPTKKVQVKWSGEAARWYPIAIKILRDLVLTNNPVEFATELLMPYTLPMVREQNDPYAYVASLKGG